MEPQFLDRFFQRHPPPPQVDAEAIRAEWLALRAPYRIGDRHPPLPVWARRPFTESGPQAWQALCQQVPGIDPSRPFCIYIHVPFCAGRCAFCDCYSFRLASHREQHMQRYVELLGQEMQLWSRLGTLAHRPVSTVHLGGGTPTFLDTAALERLVCLCRQSFALGPGTELALESTASELMPEMMSHLQALGFTRLHIGVQSLQDNVRRVINRRAMAGQVLDKIEQAVGLGWVVSVDLIFGLPGQTLDGLLQDIRDLISVGVDGFSLYELQISSSNRRFAEQHGLDHRDRRLNYLVSQVASGFLISLGYRKTLFNHLAATRDTNLYFTFPARGEDCLALGTIADGVFDDYHYRHPEYAAYCRETGSRSPALEGGLRRNRVENSLQPLVTALMAGSVSPRVVADPASRALVDYWQDLLLLTPVPDSQDLRLTGSGSWFVGNMISQLVEQVSTAGEG